MDATKVPLSERAAILLSTYNGERYLKEQIDSLLAQDYPHCDIFVRDDGSTDNTPAILKDYLPQITILESNKNLGPTQSFLELSSKLNPEYGYVFFCDQDDLWFPHKISTSVKELSQHSLNNSKPLLYFSRQILVNEASEEIGHSTLWTSVGDNNAFFHNKAPGCSMAFNNVALRLLQKALKAADLRTHINFHDWWVFMICSYVGKVIYNPTPLMAYRQHANNQVGLSASPMGMLKKFSRLKKIFKFDGYYSKQAKAFYSLYKNELSKESIVHFEYLENSKHSSATRAKLLFDSLTTRESSSAETLALKAVILTNKH